MMSEGKANEWLCNQLVRGADRLLLVDVRSRVQYDRGHIQGAVNLSCTSNLMLRRLKGGSMRLESLLHTEAEREKFALCGESSVVLYDSGPVNTQEVMSVFADRLASRCRHVCWLEGGYRQFFQEHPELCGFSRESRISDIEQGSPSLSLCSLRIGSGSSPSSMSSFELATPSVSPRILKGDPAKVADHLYLGDEKNASDAGTLLRYNIRYVLNVTDNLPNTFEGNEDMNIEYLRIPVQDSHRQNLSEFFRAASNFIAHAVNSEGNILVHCVAGISRSVTVTLAYLMIYCNTPFEEAYDLVKKSKSNVSPNFSFLGQLLELNEELGFGKSNAS